YSLNTPVSCAPLSSLLFLHSHVLYLESLSFPTRRSSDLTVKSLAKTKVLRPLTVPQPVTTPSPGTLVFSMPNSVERCSTNMSNSDRKSTRLNSSHVKNSYAVFCLKKKNNSRANRD